MELFRSKTETKKTEFRALFWVSVTILNFSFSFVETSQRKKIVNINFYHLKRRKNNPSTNARTQLIPVASGVNSMNLRLIRERKKRLPYRHTKWCLGDKFVFKNAIYLANSNNAQFTQGDLSWSLTQHQLNGGELEEGKAEKFFLFFAHRAMENLGFGEKLLRSRARSWRKKLFTTRLLVALLWWISGRVVGFSSRFIHCCHDWRWWEI